MLVRDLRKSGVKINQENAKVKTAYVNPTMMQKMIQEKMMKKKTQPPPVAKLRPGSLTTLSGVEKLVALTGTSPSEEVQKASEPI